MHVNSNQALKHTVQARGEGIPVFAETCPHCLLFDDSVYDSDDFNIAKFVMTPPLRKPDDQKHLWRALQGRVEKVFLRGQLIVDGEQWLGREGMGQFVPRGEVRAF